LEGFVLKGYGESINYKMGLPLLKDVVQSMENAIIAKEGNTMSVPPMFCTKKMLLAEIPASYSLRP
jgi:hypothetical protein